MDDKTAPTPVPEIKQLKKRFDFSSVPSDWRLAAESIDWLGDPLVLFEDGSPLALSLTRIQAIIKWRNTPPKGTICSTGPTERYHKSRLRIRWDY
jgi:hypothetical protein